MRAFPSQELYIFEPVGAGGAALGGLYTGFAHDIEIVEYNPAGLALLDTAELRTSYFTFPGGMTGYEGGLAMPLLFGTVAGGYKYNGYPAVPDNYISQGTVVNRGNIELSDFSFYSAFARPIGKGFCAGARLRFIQSTISSPLASWSATGISGDAALMYQRRLYGLPGGKLSDKDEINAHQESGRMVLLRRHEQTQYDLEKKYLQEKSVIEKEIEKLHALIEKNKPLLQTANSLAIRQLISASMERIDQLKEKSENAAALYQQKRTEQEKIFGLDREDLQEYYVALLEKYYDERKMADMNKGEKLEYQKEIALRGVQRESGKVINRGVYTIIQYGYEIENLKRRAENEKISFQKRKEFLIASMTTEAQAESDLPGTEALKDLQVQLSNEITVKKAELENILKTNSLNSITGTNSTNNYFTNSVFINTTNAIHLQLLDYANDTIALQKAFPLRQKLDTIILDLEKVKKSYSNTLTLVSVYRSNVTQASQELNIYSNALHSSTGTNVIPDQTDYAGMIQTVLKSISRSESDIVQAGELLEKFGKEIDVLNASKTSVVKELHSTMPDRFFSTGSTQAGFLKRMQKIRSQARELEQAFTQKKAGYEDAIKSYQEKITAIEKEILIAEEAALMKKAEIYTNFQKQINSESVRKQVRASIYNNAYIEELAELDNLDFELSRQQERLKQEIDTLIGEQNTLIRKKQVRTDSETSGRSQRELADSIQELRQNLSRLEAERQRDQQRLYIKTSLTIHEKLDALGVLEETEKSLFGKSKEEIEAEDRIFKPRLSKKEIKNPELKQIEDEYSARVQKIRLQTAISLKELRYKGDPDAVFRLRQEKIKVKRLQFAATIEDLDAGLRREKELIEIERRRFNNQQKMSRLRDEYRESIKTNEHVIIEWAKLSNQLLSSLMISRIDEQRKLALAYQPELRESIESKIESFDSIILGEYRKIAGGATNGVPYTHVVQAITLTERYQRERAETVGTFAAYSQNQNENYLRRKSNLFGSVAVKNIGNPLTYYQEQNKQPLEMHAELSCRFTPRITAAAGYTLNIPRREQQLHLGGQLNIFNILWLRNGVEIGPEVIRPLSAGARISIPLRISFVKIRFNLDYAFKPSTVFFYDFPAMSPLHLFSVSIKTALF